MNTQKKRHMRKDATTVFELTKGFVGEPDTKTAGGRAMKTALDMAGYVLELTNDLDSDMLWEILVPTQHNDGRPIRTRYHRVWDEKVRAVTKGLTILTPVKGQWVSDKSDLFKERMIPVRIKCTEDQINKIADITAEYYKQLAVMFYSVSNNVVIKNYGSE